MYLVGYFRSCITMHGFTNFKFNYTVTLYVHRIVKLFLRWKLHYNKYIMKETRKAE